MTAADDNELARLRAEATHHRQRLALYRAKAYSMRPTSPVRLRELEREAAASAARLAAYERRTGDAGG